MTAFKCVSFVPALVLMTATVAAAQQGRGTSSPLDHGYMTGNAGASFSDQRAATFGAEIGQRLNARTEAYVAFTYFDNLLTDRAAGDLATVGSVLSNVTGRAWEFTGRDRGLAFSGGAKYLLARGPTFRPYVGGGPGVMDVRRTITDQRRGDVSDPYLAVFGAPDGFVDASMSSTFKPMVEFAAGVGIASGRTYVDVGYRFHKLFGSDDSFSFSQFSVGVGMRF